MDMIKTEIYEDSIIELEKKYLCYRIYYEVLSTWMENDIEENSIYNYLDKRGIKTIVIYGMGGLGKILYKKLENTNISIIYTLDGNIDSEKIQKFNTKNLKNTSLDKSVDLVIITPIYAEKAIKTDLLNAGYDCNKIVTIDNLIFNNSVKSL